MDKQKKMIVGLIGAALWIPVSSAEEMDHSMHVQHQAIARIQKEVSDTRQAVQFPKALQGGVIGQIKRRAANNFEADLGHLAIAVPLLAHSRNSGVLPESCL